MKSSIMWFLKEPKDEREIALHSKAYQKTLHFLIVIVIGIWGSANFLIQFTLPLHYFWWMLLVNLFFFLVLFISLAAGWSVLKKEDLGVSKISEITDLS